MRKASAKYLGLDAAVEAKLDAFCASHTDVSGRAYDGHDALSHRPGSPAVELLYDRDGEGGKGANTCWQDSARHLDWVRRGFYAIDLRAA